MLLLGTVKRPLIARSAKCLSGTAIVLDSGSINQLPSRAQVVVCGGGIVGSSVAFHLPHFGFKDVIHLEQGSLASGTTWHSAGILSSIRGSRCHTKLSAYTSELYSSLEKSDLGTGIKNTGYLNLATTNERLTVLRRLQAVGRSLQLKCDIISGKECSDICPLLRTDDIVGALYMADDPSACDPSDVCRALSSQAKTKGVKFYEGVRVQEIEVAQGKVAGVRTNKGIIECEVFVNCAGQWARQLGNLSNPKVNIPLHSTEHFYIVTKPFQGVSLDMPTVRDQDNQIYIRQWSGGILFGCFELNGRPCFEQGVPDSFQFQLLPEDWEHCEPLMKSGINRIPLIEHAEIRQMINGPESFTPDMHAIMGEAPEIRNYYVGAGMNSTGVSTAGGFGRALAEWISRGEPPFDLWEFDIARFSPYQANLAYLKNRSREVLGRHYSIPWPKQEMETGRNIKTTPFHCKLDEAGASWGCVNGWERPNWFYKPEVGEIQGSGYTFGKPNYFKYVEKEHFACRNNVALFDLSAFVKLELEGEEALSALQRVCCNNVDVPVSRIVYTGMLNRQGGYQTDCTVVRLGEQRFLAICPSAQASHVSAWLKRNIPFSVNMKNITSHYSVVGLMGPKARELLQLVTKKNLNNTEFPYGTCQVIDVGLVDNILALRISYVGELGWELHIPTENSLYVFNQLTEAGKKFNLDFAGAYTIDNLRLEKGYRHWGHELDTETTPLEARLMHAVDLQKEFIGKEALIKQKSDGVKQLLASFKVNADDQNVFLWGKESIYRNGIYAGYITSAGYGFSVGGPVCLGYVLSHDMNVNINYLKEGKYEIEVDGKKWNAEITLKSFYDPSSKALLA